MKLNAGLVVLSALVAQPCLAQTATSTEPSPAATTLKSIWQQLTGYIITVAEELPEAKYAYKPTPEVRSFGQLIGHVAGAQYLICGAALGESGRGEDDIEKSKSKKADLVAALKASTEYCEKAYAQTEAQLAESTKLFGQQQTRLYALTLNTTHNAEHYGNLVTYLRLNGIVPPSSRQTP